MYENQRPRRKGRIGRLIVIALVLYGLYCWYFGQQTSIQYPQNHFQPVQSSEQLLNSQQIQNSRVFFSIIFSLFRAVPRLIWTILTAILSFLWYIIQGIWLIKVIWIIFMSVANVAFIAFLYFIGKRQHGRSQLYLKFIISLILMVIVPLLINRFLVHQILAYNIFLPIDLTLFVDTMGSDQMFYYTAPRNLVFFVIVCSLL